jgi:Fe-S cluster assembly iron-binding protein IscA
MPLSKFFIRTQEGLQLDLETQGTNEFLKFNNPNATHVCGCGESFQVEED